MVLDVFAALVLGSVQGLTTWIPVSSKTQVLLVGTLVFGLPAAQSLAFALLMHIGDLFAAMWLLRAELASLRVESLNPLDYARDFSRFRTPGGRLFAFLAVTMFFTGLVGLPLFLLARDSISELAGAGLLAFIGLLLIGTGLLQRHAKSAGLRTRGDVQVKDAAFTGVLQGFAVLPGVSRSGTTESALFLSGFRQDEALTLAFLLSIPTVVLALGGFSVIEGFQGISMEAIVVGNVASFVVSFVTMRFMLDLVKRVKFDVVLIALGVLALVPFVLSAMGAPV